MASGLGRLTTRGDGDRLEEAGEVGPTVRRCPFRRVVQDRRETGEKPVRG